MKTTFESKRTVQPNEIDEYNHVNNVVYVQWIQEIADEHWKVLIKDIEKLEYVWFIIRHEIDYKNQAKLGDIITVKTWVGKTEGVKSVRHVEIKRDKTLLVKSETTFCLLDAKTQKPKRITEDIKKLFLGEK